MANDFRFHHVAVIATEFERIVAWYCGNFGFSVTKEWTVPDMLPGTRMCYLRKGDMHLEVIGGGTKVGHHLVAPGPLEDYQITGFRHFAFAVDSVDAAMAELANNGVEPFFPPMDFAAIGIRAALVRDPEGNTVELVQWL